jgi:hypothetical protein
MRIQRVKFPVTCPTCGYEFLSALRVVEVDTSIRLGRPLQLYAACHDRLWTASEHELQQIREYLEMLRVASRLGDRRMEPTCGQGALAVAAVGP